MKNIKNEIIDIEGEVELVEEFLNTPSAFLDIEKNKDLIRMEMNIVEYPIFSKSKLIKENQILKYYFSTDRSSYLEITPKVNSQIPSEFDERVFIALTKLMRDNNFNRTFYTTVSQIIDNMKIENEGTKKGFYKRVKNSIERMANTNFKFKNLYYSNQESGIINDLIDTNMLTYRVITFKDAKEEEEEYFSDKRVKEIYFITISDVFHQNIIKKGYLTFDADELLSIKDPITRAIYTMITKWRNREKYLIKEAFFIARRIPLSWDNPYRTIKRLEKSCKELKELYLIKDFNLLKKGKWDEAIFEFYFSDEHNKIKQQNFYEEKKLFGKTIAFVEERSHDNEDSIISGVSIDTTEIFDIFPEVARRLKSLPLTIREALKKYEYNYVKSTAEYTALFCKTSYLKYFKEALVNNWAEEYMAKKESKAEKRAIKMESLKIEEAVIVEPQKNMKNIALWEDFLKLSLSKQEEISATAYKEYLQETGAEDDRLIKNIFEKGKKTYILKIMERYNSENIGIVKNIKETSQIAEERNINIIQESQDLNEIVGEYVSIPEFMVTVSKVAHSKNIEIDFAHLVPIFKLFGEYEDKFLKISYDEVSKKGIIRLK